MVNTQKAKGKPDKRLATNPLWNFVHFMATKGRPLRNVEILAILKHNGFSPVSRTTISLIRKELKLPRKSRSK